MQTFPDLRPILQGIDWLVVGAVAARAYMPERATQDLNILVRAADETRVAARLEAAGYERVAELEAHLMGVPYDRERLSAALADVDLDGYFGSMDVGTFIDLLY